MPLRYLEDLRKTLIRSRKGIAPAVLRDITAASYPPVSSTFEVTAHPRVLKQIQAKVALYQEDCARFKRMVQIQFVPKSKNVGHLILSSPYAYGPGTPEFIKNLGHVTNPQPADPNAPASLTAMRNKLRGID